MKKDPTIEDLRVESALLKALSIKKHYNVFEKSIDKTRLLPNTVLVLDDYSKYFKAFNHSEIDWPTFITEFSQNWHSKDLDTDDVKYYRDVVFTAIDRSSADDMNQVILGLLNRNYSDLIMSDLKKGLDPVRLANILEEYNLEKTKYCVDVDEEAFSITDVDFSILDKEKGLQWFLPSLQKALGSLVQGQFVVVAADANVGKSGFVISQAVHMFKQLHKAESTKPILYFNSEGTQADVFTRFLSCLYHKHVVGGFEEIFTRIDEVRQKFISQFNSDNFLVFQITQGDMSKIKQKIDLYNPSIVIIDIADVLAPDEDVRVLKKLYDGLRLLSANTCPIIATTQSGNTKYEYFDQEKQKKVTKTKKWLTLHDLYNGRTGKGGAADTVIGISKDDEMNSIRYICTPKKKRGASVEIIAEFNESYSLYTELV